jgi:hypothetical protein
MDQNAFMGVCCAVTTIYTTTTTLSHLSRLYFFLVLIYELLLVLGGRCYQKTSHLNAFYYYTVYVYVLGANTHTLAFLWSYCIDKMGKHGQNKKNKVNKKNERFMKKSSQDQVNKKNVPKNKPVNVNPSHTKKTATSTESTGDSKLSALQQKFQKKLEGARFRVINERLYTCRGSDAFHEFQQNSGLFDIVSNLHILITEKL